MAQVATRQQAGGDAPGRTRLLETGVALVEDVRGGRQASPATGSFSPRLQIALPYRGFFVWHVGGDEVAGDASQALFITAGEEYALSQPVQGGYAELILTPTEGAVAELFGARCGPRRHALFRRRSRRLDGRLQSLRAHFLAWARRPDRVDPLAAEEQVIQLIRAALDDGAPPPAPARCTQRLIARAKAFLQANASGPVRLADVGRAVGASPVYLTTVFRQVEGVPLHRYLTELRLSRALADLPHAEDLTLLALEAGFSSHSHFTACFRRVFQATPSALRRSLRSGTAPG